MSRNMLLALPRVFFISSTMVARFHARFSTKAKQVQQEIAAVPRSYAGFRPLRAKLAKVEEELRCDTQPPGCVMQHNCVWVAHSVSELHGYSAKSIGFRTSR